MPPVLIATIAIAGGVALATEVMFTTALTVASIAVSAYTFFTTKKVGQHSLEETLRLRKTMIRSTVASRSKIYGTARISGALIFASVTGNDNQFLHMVVALADHEVQDFQPLEIDDLIFFNDKPISYYDQFKTIKKMYAYIKNGTVSSNIRLTINDSAGSRTYTAATMVLIVSAFNTGEFDSQAIFIDANKIQIDAESDSTKPSWGFSDYVFTLSVLYDTESDSETKTDVRGTSEVLQENFSPYRISFHTGSPSQLADPLLVSEVEEWTTNHKLSGIAYVYARLQWGDDVWGDGVPNISAVLDGKSVYDPRSGLTEFSNNWALCINDYLKDADGLGATDSEVDEANIIAAANACDELVPIDTLGATQRRYTLDGVVDLNQSPRSILDQMLTAGAGSLSYTQGVFKLFAGVYTAPVKTLTVNDLSGSIRVRPKPSMMDSFNAVKGVFADPDHYWEASDFPPVTNSFYETQDGGERRYIDIELPFTTNSIRAQRLAKIMLEKSRQGITVSWPGNLSGLELEPLDTVRVSVSQLGWGTVGASKLLQEDGGALLQEDGGALLLEVAGGKIFQIAQWEVTQNGGVDMVFIEEASEVYDWNLGNQTIVDVAANTNLPNPFSVDPPTDFFFDSGDDQLLIGNDGSIITRWFASWTPPDSGFIIGYDLSWKEKGTGAWTTVRTSTAEFYITGVADLIEYDIQVRAINSIGVKSGFLIGSHSVLGKSEPPPDLSSFLIKTQADGTRDFSWVLSDPPVDLAGYKIRYKLGTGGTWATMVDMHTGLLTSSPFESNALAAGSYTFGIKAIDTSGNESLNAKIIEGSLGDPRFGGALDEIDFKALGWPSTLTNGWVSSDGDVHAKDQKDWDDFAIDVVDWDNWTTWARDPFTTITYEHEAIDIGVKIKFRPLVSVITDAATIVTQEAHSDDDISYTSFANIDGSEIEARYVKIKVSITDVVNNPPTIENVLVILSAKAVSEDLEDLDISTLTGANRIAVGHVKLPIQNTYVIIKRVDLVMQNVGSGWTWELISKADLTNGAEIKIYDNTGTLADATIDATIRGL